jgi:hypothetical protein
MIDIISSTKMTAVQHISVPCIINASFFFHSSAASGIIILTKIPALPPPCTEERVLISYPASADVLGETPCILLELGQPMITSYISGIVLPWLSQPSLATE